MRVNTRSHNQKAVIDLLPIQIFIDEKVAPIHLADFSAGRLKNNAGGCKILIGLIGDHGSFCTTHGHITYVGAGAAQIADFSRKC